MLGYTSAQFAFLVVVFLVVSGIPLGAWLMLRRTAAQQRLARVVGPAQPGAFRDRDESAWIETLAKVATPLAKVSLPEEGWEGSELRRRFMHAGLRSANAPVFFFAIKTLLAFGLPPVLQLAQVPPLRVIRRDVGQLKPASLLVLAVGVTGFAALLLAASSDIRLGGIAVGGFAGAVLVFAGLSWVAVWLLRRVVNEATAPRWLVLATRQIGARPAYAVVQSSALAVGLLALVLLVLLRTDLIASWRQATPRDAPNRFVINVLPEQSQAFLAQLRAAGVQRLDWYPMFRGRLVAINGRGIGPDDYQEDRARRLVDREFNLSFSAQQPAHNEIVAGRWVPNEAAAVSVEEGLAKTLGLKLGDVLRFDVAGMPSEARITSLRKVDWGSMHANFFVMYPVAELPGMPVTYMGAFRAPERRGFDNALVRAFPNITNVDMTAT